MVPNAKQAFYNSAAPIVALVAFGLDFIGAAKSAAVRKLTGNPTQEKTSFICRIMGPYV